MNKFLSFFMNLKPLLQRLQRKFTLDLYNINLNSTVYYYLITILDDNIFLNIL